MLNMLAVIKALEHMFERKVNRTVSVNDEMQFMIKMGKKKLNSDSNSDLWLNNIRVRKEQTNNQTRSQKRYK